MLLQNLMSLEQGRRALSFWELTTPVPVDEDPEKDVARRIAEVQQSLRLAYLINPEMIRVKNNFLLQNYLFTLLLKSLPVLKTGSCLGFTFTLSPVLGFLPK